MSEIDDPRREFLIRALSAGVFASSQFGIMAPLWAMGKIPRELPPGKFVYDYAGQVKIDGRPANLDSKITASSVIETGDDSHIIFVYAKDAFILRNNSHLQMEGKGIITGFRILTGKVLSVFGKRKQGSRPIGLKTTAATIGIRGTGIYVEAEPEQSYVCTCYGVADIAAINDKSSRETVHTHHHDSPRFIHTNGSKGGLITPAPVINHTDDELILIETLVGRTVPFVTAGGYSAPRKTTY